MDVSPGRQDVGRPDQVAARNRGDVARRQGPHQGGQFGVLREQRLGPTSVGPFGHQGNHVGARRSTHRAAQHVQPVGDQRALDLLNGQP